MRNVGGFLAALAASTLVLTACTSGGDPTSPATNPSSTASSGAPASTETLTIWTLEDVSERVEAQRAIIDKWSATSGIKVELVALAADQLFTVLASNAAAGTLPDAIGAVSLNNLSQLNNDGVLDTAAAAAIVDALGPDTFSASSLALTRNGDEQLGVPSDSWAQLLFYRKDIFDKAGLSVPNSYEAIMKAATTLQSNDLAGIVASTIPNDSFTQQTFEHFAVANGCELVDDAGNVTLNSPQCVESIGFYTDLIKDGSVEGIQDADTTRASYFAGNAAMVVWSSFLLDELAGLRNDALPNCPECTDPLFLANNTGIVSAISGPSGSAPASFGEIVSWAVLDGAGEGTQDLMQYMMGDGYLDWLAISPEGKVPTRMGTSDQPTLYSDGWAGLEAGVDKKALLSSVFSADVLKAVVDAPGTFDRWGLPQGQGALSGAVSSQYVIPQILSETINSGLSAQDAADQAAEEATALKEELG